MRPQDMDEEQHKAIEKKLEEVGGFLKDMLGADTDVLIVAHKQHAQGEPCEGAFVLVLPIVGIGQTYQMLMQGMTLVQGAMIQEVLENQRPLGTKLQ